MKIVFVCTANICRSPMAEGMFRKMIEENGLEESVFCLSFGLAAKEGKRPPENAVAVCREIGVDISGHKARNLSSLKDLDIFDAFVVMTETQAYVLKQAGVPEDKLYLLGEEEIKDRIWMNSGSAGIRFGGSFRCCSKGFAGLSGNEC